MLRPRSDICQLCDYMLPRQLSYSSSCRPRNDTYNTHTFSTARRFYGQKKGFSVQPEPYGAIKAADVRRQAINGKQQDQSQRDGELQIARASSRALLSLDRVPAENEIIAFLKSCQRLVTDLVEDASQPLRNGKDDSPTSALLSLDDSITKKPQKMATGVRRIMDELSGLAYSIVKHPPVFISPAVLKTYVQVQSSIGQSQSFPEVFDLYANKPVPQEGSSPIKYSNQNPNKVANSVPLAVADMALQTAIDAKQLANAVDIIESTYTTKAFHRAKFIRKALLPATAAAVAPVAAYSLASQLSQLQTTMDSAMATNVAFAGFLAYIGFTATIGIVAVTTANDQMERVTWAQGIPLRERWIREEERAAIDQVAMAWGFREGWRRGEEEGAEWDALREWIGRRGMILDRVELMEGME